MEKGTRVRVRHNSEGGTTVRLGTVREIKTDPGGQSRTAFVHVDGTPDHHLVPVDADYLEQVRTTSR